CGADCMVATDIGLSSNSTDLAGSAPGPPRSGSPAVWTPVTKTPLRRTLREGARTWGGDPQGCRGGSVRPGSGPPPLIRLASLRPSRPSPEGDRAIAPGSADARDSRLNSG